MIGRLWNLSVGNAVRVFITPPRGTLYWRILRRTADAFTGYNDPGAVVVAEDSADNALLDTFDLVNGTEYFYREYDWNGTAWIDSGVSASTTPSATYEGDHIEPQLIVRERLELGLAVEVARGALKPQTGVIKVTTAPFALRDGINFPTASVHMDNTLPASRAIGDMLYPDSHDLTDQDVMGTEGWFARTALKVVGVSLNPDERIDLRMAVRRVIQANLPVFDNAGMIEIDFAQQDTEQFYENNAPLYFTEGTFTCLSPAFIQDQVPEVACVNVAVNTVWGSIDG